MENCNQCFWRPAGNVRKQISSFLETFGNTPKQSGKGRLLSCCHPKHAGKDYIMQSRLRRARPVLGRPHSSGPGRRSPIRAPGEPPPVMAMQDGPDQGPMPWHGPMRPGPEGFGPHRMGPPPEFMLAARLAVLETRVGIRSRAARCLARLHQRVAGRADAATA